MARRAGRKRHQRFGTLVVLLVALLASAALHGAAFVLTSAFVRPDGAWASEAPAHLPNALVLALSGFAVVFARRWLASFDPTAIASATLCTTAVFPAFLHVEGIAGGARDIPAPPLAVSIALFLVSAALGAFGLLRVLRGPRRGVALAWYGLVSGLWWTHALHAWVWSPHYGPFGTGAPEGLIPSPWPALVFLVLTAAGTGVLIALRVRERAGAGPARRVLGASGLLLAFGAWSLLDGAPARPDPWGLGPVEVPLSTTLEPLGRAWNGEPALRRLTLPARGRPRVPRDEWGARSSGGELSSTELRAWLAQGAAPAGILVVQADARADFAEVERLAAHCVELHSGVTRIELLVREDSPPVRWSARLAGLEPVLPGAGVLPLELAPGGRISVGPPPDEGSAPAAGRARLEVAPGTSCGAVVAAIDRWRAAGGGARTIAAPAAR